MARLREPVVMPDPVIAVREYLLGDPLITELVADRVTTDLPADPAWPRVRITGLNSYQVFPCRLDRVLMQFDCYALTSPEAQRLAQVVRAVIAASPAHVGTDAVFSGVTGVSIFELVDGSFTPPMPRWSVTAYVYLRSNP